MPACGTTHCRLHTQLRHRQGPQRASFGWCFAFGNSMCNYTSGQDRNACSRDRALGELAAGRALVGSSAPVQITFGDRVNI
eukprot:1157615-Pelagomonas_calceolata.AAC.2